VTHDPAALRRSHRLRDTALYLGRPVPELTAAAVDTYLDELADNDPGLAAALTAADEQRARSGRWGARMRLVPNDPTESTGWPT
jgi:hypothetical protein